MRLKTEKTGDGGTPHGSTLRRTLNVRYHAIHQNISIRFTTLRVTAAASTLRRFFYASAEQTGAGLTPAGPGRSFSGAVS